MQKAVSVFIPLLFSIIQVHQYGTPEPTWYRELG